jgi:hypothetical protein
MEMFDRVASLESKIQHFLSEVQRSADGAPVIAPDMIEIQDVYMLGCASVDHFLGHFHVRVEGDLERAEVLRKLSTINSEFDAVYVSFSSFKEAYESPVPGTPIGGSGIPGTDFPMMFHRLMSDINKAC